jgi:Fe-Mn family superoxide dismutase
MSAETLEFHHDKHHATYVTNLNKLTEDAGYTDADLEKVIMESDGPLFNNAAQTWNHTFFWSCMAPGGGGQPTGAAAEAINSAFGSYEAFGEEFSQAATTQFGSGWAWLTHDGSKLAVTKTSNADLPMKHGQKALLTIDVWEHAYYIDYRNARPKYLEAWFDNLVNWDHVLELYEAANK